MSEPIAIDEERRLAALHALALHGVCAGESFDALAALAAEMLGCPLAALTLIGREQLWVTARSGDLPDAIEREVAMCNHTIRGTDALIVPDLAIDRRFEANPLVTEGGLRFYAGMPIHAIDDAGVRQPIGSLCVMDRMPRSLSSAGHGALRHLATLAEALIAARRTALRAIEYAQLSQRQAGDLQRHARTFAQAERLSAMGSWRLTLTDERVEWSDGVFRIYGLPPGDTPAVGEAMTRYPAADRALLSAALSRCIETGEPFDLELDFIAADGDARRVRSMGERELADGVPVALVGVFQDVTERHRLEAALCRSAECDGLTGLANRSTFERALKAAMERARAHGTPLSLVMIDLDGFKAINDTLGHLAGDDVLKAVGRRLSAPWLAGCLAARLGGDEFALIVDNPVLAADPATLVVRLEEALCRPVTGDDGLTIASAGTVGLAAFEPGMRSLRDFVHATDLVLYAAKRRRIGERRIAGRRASDQLAA